ncbi:MAG: ParB/RepB/Spo0J family partition protein [Oscillospiraceae bacterium]|nr:ParB/RepB/Spo0J family partition protein [Oscillospiraceae bacterium]MCI1989873.1 ParB/RepB/Spo0J family partition protein [Oscillospiraceae bacterium]MCI2034902.1 ParB/RepB/Spo0J family partition protein [Oscillospiraceae bacterium]
MLHSEKNRVVEIDIDRILPNPAQPRRFFDEQEMENLSQSIRVSGLIQPLLVRHVAGGYELVAGERRLRACKLAGMKTVSCIVSDCSADASAVMAMTENLQRQDLGMFEEAEGIRRLIETWHVTQEEAAYRLGKSQSAVANKLRLLRLGEEERKKIIAAGLTERHARALLRIDDKALRMRSLSVVIDRRYNVRQTDEYVLKLIASEETGKQHQTLIIKDVRIFLNTISHAVETMKQSGISAQTLKSETEEYIECIVRIPKAQATAGGKKPA